MEMMKMILVSSGYEPHVAVLDVVEMKILSSLTTKQTMTYVHLSTGANIVMILTRTAGTSSWLRSRNGGLCRISWEQQEILTQGQKCQT